MDPVLSVIIPIVEESHIGRVVAALLDQSADPASYEVLVSDSRAGAWQAPIERLATQNPSIAVRYLSVDRGRTHRGRGINAAVREAKGRLVCLLAGDFTVEREFIAAHLRLHNEHPETEAVGIGPGVFVEHQRKHRFVEWLESSKTIFGANTGVGDADGYFYCGNVSLKTEFFDRAGGFDEDFLHDAMDDYEFGVRLRRAGMRSYYAPDALAWHEHHEPPGVTQRAAALARAGESAMVYERKHPGPYEWTNSCARSPLRLELDAALWGSAFLLRRRPEDLGKYYSCRMDAAFVRGWRKATRSRGGRSPLWS